jgi:hypothetical protein
MGMLTLAIVLCASLAIVTTVLAFGVARVAGAGVDASERDAFEAAAARGLVDRRFARLPVVEERRRAPGGPA